MMGRKSNINYYFCNSFTTPGVLWPLEVIPAALLAVSPAPSYSEQPHGKASWSNFVYAL